VEHGNEQAHAAHVASLALSLFDATADFLDVPAEDRPLLEAACRLHEVGYGGSPRRHARAGYEIVRDERLEGFTSSALDDIAAAIYLHPHGLLLPPTARWIAAFALCRGRAGWLHTCASPMGWTQRTYRTLP